MATIQNESDIVLQTTSPRLLSSPLNYLSIIPTTNTVTSTSGVLTPSSVTIIANLNGALQGIVSWSLSPSVTYSNVSGGISITSTDLPAGTSVLVTASLTYAGNVYSSSTTITRKQAVQLSSSGVLTGENGGSITALDYGNVSGTKPPATATSNYFSTSASNPTGGGDGDAHYNSSTDVMWFKVSGTWTRGGTINAGEITTGTLAAARIAAGSITADKLSVSSLSAVSANLGTVTAGSITGTANIDIAGYATFNGSATSTGFSYCMLVNTSKSTTRGIKAFAAENTSGVGVYGDGGTQGTGVVGVISGGTGAGLRGISAVYSGNAVEASNNAGGYALVTSGISSFNGNIIQNSGTSSLGALSCASLGVASSTLVNNLNADYLDGYHASSFCSIVPCNTGTCTVSGQGFNLLVTVSGVQSRGTSNYVYIENTSDIRLKTDITEEVLSLDFINKLNPVTYRWKNNPKVKYHGFIAQDVQPFIDTDDDSLFTTNEEGTHGVDYMSIIAPLVKAVQELSARVDYLEKKNSKL